MANLHVVKKAASRPNHVKPRCFVAVSDPPSIFFVVRVFVSEGIKEHFRVLVLVSVFDCMMINLFLLLLNLSPKTGLNQHHHRLHPTPPYTIPLHPPPPPTPTLPTNPKTFRRLKTYHHHHPLTPPTTNFSAT